MEHTDAVVKTDQTLQLPDGRMLGFAEYGSPDGNVLVYCHGYPGSRLEAAALSAHAAEAHIRVLALIAPATGVPPSRTTALFSIGPATSPR